MSNWDITFWSSYHSIMFISRNCDLVPCCLLCDTTCINPCFQPPSASHTRNLMESLLIPDVLFISGVVTVAAILITICLITYSIIFVTIYKQANKVTSLNGKPQAAADFTKVKKTTKTMAILLGAMLFCWVPTLVWMTYLQLKGQEILLDPFHNMANITIPTVAFLNSLINPFIYAIKMKEFRKGYLATLMCRKYQP